MELRHVKVSRSLLIRIHYFDDLPVSFQGCDLSSTHIYIIEFSPRGLTRFNTSFVIQFRVPVVVSTHKFYEVISILPFEVMHRLHYSAKIAK